MKNLNEYLLDKTKIDFDVTCVSESRIKKDKSPINRINLKGYSPEFCPTESAADGTLLYISNNFPYNLEMIDDLQIYRIRVNIYWNFKSRENKCECGWHLSPSSYGSAWF